MDMETYFNLILVARNSLKDVIVTMSAYIRVFIIASLALGHVLPLKFPLVFFIDIPICL